MTDKSISLSDTQLAIMRVLWAAGESDTQSVRDSLGSARRKPAYSTVSTLLKRLERRGLISHRQDGRKQVFRPQITEAEVRSSMVSDLIGSLFRGDSNALVSHLLREHEATPGDLQTLLDMIDREKKS